MNDYAVYFMLHSIEKVRGGMTRAAIQRAKMLSRFYEEVGLITFDFNPDYEDVIQHYNEIGLWNDKIKHHNVYEFLKSLPDIVPQAPIQGSNNSAEEISLVHPLKKHVLYDRKGRPRKVTHYDDKNGKATKELLIAEDGRCFLKRNFQPVSYVWLDRNGTIRKSFKTVKDYRHHFIQSLINNREAILLSDSRFTDKILMGVKNNKMAKVAVLHSNHLQSPYQYGSTLVKRNELLFGRMNHFDAVVTLTERQAEDIGNRFGRRSTIHTVGHPALVPNESGEAHDPYLAVMLARYSGIKQIPHAIKAFKRVVKKVPEAKLEIWGFGKEEYRYKRLIKRLGLDRNVFIKGFTNDIEGAYRRAAFSLITSKSEAFGMSIIESMSIGTPVICYACKYGPVDIITDGKNGLLVEPGDIKGLADTMIDLFINMEKRLALSKEAMKVTEVFAEKRLADRWNLILEEARKQKDQRVHIKEVEAEFTNVAFNKMGIEIKGKIRFNGLEAAFRHKTILFLQLRKRKDMEDIYAPLKVNWENPNLLIFKGEFTELQKLHKGQWDINISISCLNFHQFLQPKLSTPVFGFGEANSDVKLLTEGQHVCLKVYRPKKKRAFNAYFFLEKYKAKIRDRIRNAKN
ncbi:glycosyltransferase [Siminovitchia acidinfaciens]|uniref:Glycosyltransferase n=1 Tax=Siminovitchia acidinfaciens TaxID=2321395 RepID=A0A429XW40_9BACI|nr:glycosyltransferase [Siminovitchia acidinfaciens]RST72574.1 glycosyltransferase [Siminovitchia acidinfaciens]